MSITKLPKREVTRKHHKAVFKALKEVLAKETWKQTYGDEKLAELIKAKGVYASQPIVYSVRLANGIGDAYERKMAKFAEQAKGTK